MSFGIDTLRSDWTAGSAAPPAAAPAATQADQLDKAAPDQARKIVDGLTPEQTQALKKEVQSMPVADREQLINGLATKLDAGQLVKLDQVFGRETVAHAVETFGNSTTQADYRRLTSEGTVTREGNRVVIEAGNGDDRVNVERNADTGDVTVTVNGKQHTFSATDAEHITIRTHGGNDVINVAPDAQINTTLEGGAGNDVIAGGAGADTIDGGAGDDILIGGRGSDRTVGGGGNDQIRDHVALTDLGIIAHGIGTREGAGNDIVEAGDGNDTIDTGNGDDRISAGAGEDKVNAGEGQDTIAGDDGNDRIQAGAGHDQVEGGKGDDYVDGSTGNDRVNGGEGADTLYAGEGDDTVEGGAGKDYIDGYLGKDLLVGGAGDDIVSGGRDDDTIFGNDGNDVVYTGGGRDFVGDLDGTNTVYHQGEDTLFVNDATRNNTNTRVVDVANVPDNIRIEGSPEFQARMRADLETLAMVRWRQPSHDQRVEPGEWPWRRQLLGRWIRADQSCVPSGR
jgi:Ca2+-binding RTX toxin-like protein